MNNSELRRKFKYCLTDVMNNNTTKFEELKSYSNSLIQIQCPVAKNCI